MLSSHGPALHILSGLDCADAASLQLPGTCRQLLELTQLPLRCVTFLSETSLVGAGFDGQVGTLRTLVQPLQNILLEMSQVAGLFAGPEDAK